MAPEILAAILFGFSTDFADLLDEHGLKWFPGANIFFGILWGVAGAVMIFLIPSISAFVFGLLLYWILMEKIDYLNHLIATVIILLTVSWYAYLGAVDFFLVGVFLFSYLIIAAANSFLKKKYGNLKFLVARHYIPTILLSLVSGDVRYMVIQLATMLGFSISDRWFRWFEKAKGLNFFKRIGLSINS